jgi:hypothetical protein
LLQQTYSRHNQTESSAGKRLIIGVNTPEFYVYSQYAKTEEFKEKYKNRSCHEWKNGEMKRFHGLGRAREFCLKSMQTKAELTSLAVNLKRIAELLSPDFKGICYYIRIMLKIFIKK